MGRHTQSYKDQKNIIYARQYGAVCSDSEIIRRYNVAKKQDLCQCTDPTCPYCKDDQPCVINAEVTLYRTDIEDKKGTRFCTECGDHAMDGDEEAPGNYTDRSN